MPVLRHPARLGRQVGTGQEVDTGKAGLDKNVAHSLRRSEKHASRHRAFWFVTNNVQYQLVWFVYVVVVVVGLVWLFLFWGEKNKPHLLDSQANMATKDVKNFIKPQN